MFFPRAIAFALALGAAVPAVQAADQTATYDFYVSGIKVGTMSLATQEGARDYGAQARINAAGIIGALLTFSFDGTSKGTIKGGAPVPMLFEAVSDSPKGRRTTRIDWKNGVPTKVVIDPPRDHDPDPKTQGGTLDPIAAGFALLRDGPEARMCATSVDLFDGSRRSRLRLGDRTATEDGFACAGTYARLEGEPHSLSSQREFPFTLYFSARDGTAQLRRIQTKTSFGLATLERRS
jgi:hypothetical protein